MLLLPFLLVRSAPNHATASLQQQILCGVHQAVAPKCRPLARSNPPACGLDWRWRQCPFVSHLFAANILLWVAKYPYTVGRWSWWASRNGLCRTSWGRDIFLKKAAFLSRRPRQSRFRRLNPCVYRPSCTLLACYWKLGASSNLLARSNHCL